MRRIFAILIVFPVLLFSAVTVAQQTSSLASNPLASDPRAAYAGGVIFRAQCATCHGADARGIESIDAPDLTLMWTRGARTEAELFATIRNGIPGSIMPAHGFPDPQVWMLVSYLKSIAVTGTSVTLTGDAGHGQSLYRQHCAECHRVDGSGGSLGPALSNIAARRSYAALVEAIRDPAATIGRNYQAVQLTTATGEQVRGAIKSEDAFSLQIMDTHQQLRAFQKKELRALTRLGESLMPAFAESVLSATEIDDLLTYLQARP